MKTAKVDFFITYRKKIVNRNSIFYMVCAQIFNFNLQIEIFIYLSRIVQFCPANVQSTVGETDS